MANSRHSKSDDRSNNVERIRDIVKTLKKNFMKRKLVWSLQTLCKVK